VNKKKVIERLVSKELIQNSKAYFKQVSILKSLLKDYPDELFWSNIKFDFPLTSLFFFKTKKGGNILSLKYKDYTSSQQKQDTFSFSWGEDFKIQTKTKNIKDFLNE
jgi:hypothetical protein